MPRLCGFYLGICLTTEEETRKTLTEGSMQGAYTSSCVYRIVTKALWNTVLLAHPVVAMPAFCDPNCSIQQCAPLVPVVCRGRWRPNLPFCFPNVRYNLNYLRLGSPRSPRRFCGRVFLLRSPEPIVTLDWIYFGGRRIECIPVLVLPSMKPCFDGQACHTHPEVWLVSTCKWKSIPENSSISWMLQRVVVVVVVRRVCLDSWWSYGWFSRQV